ncbi:MAG: extracellular solute-binding protein [Nitrososphaeria archaeon]
MLLMWKKLIQFEPSPTVQTIGYDQQEHFPLTGQYAMFIAWTSFLPIYNSNISNIKGNVGIALLPGGMTGFAPTFLGINPYGPDPKLAAEFIAFALSDQEYEKGITMMQYVPGTYSGIQLAARNANLSWLGPFANFAMTAHIPPMLAATVPPLSGLSMTLIPYFNNEVYTFLTSTNSSPGYAMQLLQTAAYHWMTYIEEHLNKYPRQLSGGQQQRVALARAVIKEPKILLLDEPLSNLDAKVRVEVRGYLKTLQRQLGITALHVTHDQLEAMAIADNIVIISQGAIEQTGSPREVYENPGTLFVANFIGSFNVLSKDYFHLNLDADYVGFRPEAAEVLLDETPGSIKGKVLYTEFQGSESIVHLQVDGNRIKIRDTKNLELAPGQEVYIKVRKMYLIKGERIIGSV